MNNKFFDLKKEKQDRIINSALKVIAVNGYENASTEDMVKEASISKGLIFHYFFSKIGIFEFLYDYSIRYCVLELRSLIRQPSSDYFAFEKQLLEAQVDILRQYPYMLLFLDDAGRESLPELTETVNEKKGSLDQCLSDLRKDIKTPFSVMNNDHVLLSELIEDGKLSMMRRELTRGTFTPEIFLAQGADLLDTLRRISAED